MIERVISGGQTGADQAAWRAAKRCGLITGGWMPHGFLTENGPRPEFAELYGAKEHASPDYPPRTRANIEWCDGVVLFGYHKSRGTRLALSICDEIDRPVYFVMNPRFSPKNLASWLHLKRVTRPNVAGNRESASPGIGEWVERFLVETFTLMGYPPDE